MSTCAYKLMVKGNNYLQYLPHRAAAQYVEARVGFPLEIGVVRFVELC